MKWKIAQPEDEPALRQFILARERHSVVFSSCLREKDFIQPHRPGAILRYPDHGCVRESIMLSPGGVIMPVLATPSVLADSLTANPLIRFLDSHYPLHCLMGLHRDIRLLEKIIRRPVGCSIDYSLMALDKKNFISRLSLPREKHWDIHQAAPRDLHRLLPLQIAYEKEEVCLEPDKFSATACQYNLKKSLKQQIVFWLGSGSKALAKAGTNARGYKTAQLGGIFTVPAERNRGIAFRLLHVLLTHLFKQVDTVCLFVKPANKAAVTLYTNLGFRQIDRYRISYFTG